MANTIKPKRSYTINAVPLLSDLAVNEICINWADGKIYVRSPSNEIISWSLSAAGSGGGGSATPAITITSQPTNQTASNGAATFAVAATVTGGATLSYQWQKQESGAGEFASVSGATSSSLALTGLTVANDNGDVYRVVVSATGGAESVTSNGATLTVPQASPSSVTVSGGQYWWTGTYTLDGESGGRPRYGFTYPGEQRNYIYWTGSEWRIGVPAYNSIWATNSNDTPYPPDIGWSYSGVVVTGGSTVPAPVISITSQPTNQTASGGSATFSIAANVTLGATISYQWQKQESGAGSFVNVGGATSSSLALSGLTNANDNGDVYRCVVSATGGAESVTSSSATLTVDESGVIADNILRFTVSDSTTTASVSAETTTGYFKVVSNTGQTSGVVNAGGTYGSYPYFATSGTVSGMPSGQPKTLQVISCDASGEPSGDLEYVSFASSSAAQITRIDASGCTELRGLRASSITAPQYGLNSPTSLPSALTEIRCVGVRGTGGGWYQWGPYPAEAFEGINVAGQQLTAAALNQMYTDLGTRRGGSAAIMVVGNPGTAADDPTIATAKGYTVFGS